jgi:hypothetical protein
VNGAVRGFPERKTRTHVRFAEVYVKVPTLKQRYRYLYVDNEVILVDPASNEIVEIIRD